MSNKLTDIDKRVMQSLWNSGEMTLDAIADEYSCSVNFVRQVMGEEIKPKAIDRLYIDFGRGKSFVLDVPCFGTLSYDDVSTMQDAIFNHYFPNESNEVVDP